MNKFEILDGFIEGIFGDVFILVKIKNVRCVVMLFGLYELDWI